VLEEVAAWQARPLDPAYPLVFFDAIWTCNGFAPVT
jgi:transposase-like protein